MTPIEAPTIARTFKQADGTYTARVIRCLPPGVPSELIYEVVGFSTRQAAMAAAKAAKGECAA